MDTTGTMSLAPPLSQPDSLTRLAAQIFHPMGVDGVYARSALYMQVLGALDAYLSRWRDPSAEVIHFPPVMSRHQLVRSGYLDSFPNLLGCVCSLHGAEAGLEASAERLRAGGDWVAALAPSDLVLTPAACYPVYPLVASRGRLSAGGLLFDIDADCFRREPSALVDRLQSFRMREFVRVGTAIEVMEFREKQMANARDIATELGLAHAMELAADPFFGKVGQIKAVSQRQQELKFELLIQYHPAVKPTACMSFNYHRDHFGSIWSIKGINDWPAHTGCSAYGMDRLTIALFAIHGLDLQEWPIRTRLALFGS